MIYVAREIEVNKGLSQGEPHLTRSQVWKGLVMKAENALPFVPGMLACTVVERFEGGLVRDIDFRGERAREKITFRSEEKVTFVRLSGNADGFIVNEILGTDDDLRLKFSFAMQLLDDASGSPAERDMGDVMERDYLKAVEATVRVIRQMVAQGEV
ncbi:SRPBCC family protein [Variovorax sp. J31P179]|nr:SRPBCC family protein [Variovorax sp. J31P179]MDM0084637.1 SRPBCC family protein [Variovorax sp. J31P179]